MIEKRLQEVFECNKRCVNAYQNSPDMTTRYKTFNELTCRLGDGFEAAEGYLDYRKDGVAGMRSIVVDFLCHIQSMAEARLLLEELETPNGRDINNIPSVERNKSRWTILWNGKDMVLHVLHG